jgi:glutaredoxin-like YruB-family protein
MNIKVYSTTTCPWCTKVKDYLKSKGLEFENVDVSANREAAMEMVQKTQQMGVPVTEIDGEFVIGYDTAKIDELISKAE